MTEFSKYNLSETLNKSLKNINFKNPTPIQDKSIPLILEGNDILGSAQTGTGKTAAYSIPIIELLLKSKQSSVLILIPTRELAKQVLDVIHSLLGFKAKINSVSLIGGESMSKQLSQLRRRPRIFVGTPGRINDHLERGTVNFKDVKHLVLDETDRMLDMGFEVQINKILKHIKNQKQILMFSATIPKDIIKLSSKYLTDPVRVSVGDSNEVAKNITQEIKELKSDEKLDELIKQINERSGSILIFVKTKYGTEKLAKSLSKNKIKSFPLHGGLRQSKRNTVMKKFREMKFRILIATDVAARGLDVPHIEHVINYDLPQLAEDFIHRIGRTARAGLKGVALTFVTKGDFSKWREIQNILNPNEKNNKFKNFSKKSSNKNKNFDRNKKNKRFSKNKKYLKGDKLLEDIKFKDKKYSKKSSFNKNKKYENDDKNDYFKKNKFSDYKKKDLNSKNSLKKRSSSKNKKYENDDKPNNTKKSKIDFKRKNSDINKYKKKSRRNNNNEERVFKTNKKKYSSNLEINNKKTFSKKRSFKNKKTESSNNFRKRRVYK